MKRPGAPSAFFNNAAGVHGWDLDDWFRAEAEILRPVPIEMSESDESYTIRAEVPGFDAKNLSIQADSNAVYIRGRNEQKREEKQRRRGQIQRIICHRTVPSYCFA